RSRRPEAQDGGGRPLRPRTREGRPARRAGAAHAPDDRADPRPGGGTPRDGLGEPRRARRAQGGAVIAEPHWRYRDPLEPALHRDVSPDVLMEHVRAIAAWERESGSAGEARAFDYIEDTLKRYGAAAERLRQLLWVRLHQGAVRITLTTRVRTGWIPIPLLVAHLDGHVEDRFVLLSGHVDSWHHGAMDNAAANATMLEVARLLGGR